MATRPHMAKRRRTKQPEMLSRSIEVSSCRMTVRIHASSPKGEEPFIETQPWLELRGRSLEPIREVHEVALSLDPKEPLQVGTVKPTPCGVIVQMRPEVHVVFTWPHVDFDRVWALAIYGQLKYARLYFT